jgi:hypothetical protein
MRSFTKTDDFKVEDYKNTVPSINRKLQGLREMQPTKNPLETPKPFQDYIYLLWISFCIVLSLLKHWKFREEENFKLDFGRQQLSMPMKNFHPIPATHSNGTGPT